ncbi:hypothetical protein H1P_1690008 [Hyella patelloides LEGE 07179]|uniref:Uncharacterized protein n=1 Tax=Hyella patelloides LEGE 07179 TaxID=945734 RepID=A0A563VN46_9CYAN|nr:hypothetical protein H1P_1690008 [Hyella patelloides LEGE 07179]
MLDILLLNYKQLIFSIMFWMLLLSFYLYMYQNIGDLRYKIILKIFRGTTIRLKIKQA